jgi:protein involved in polysaccharide export with SLBB domain
MLMTHLRLFFILVLVIALPRLYAQDRKIQPGDALQIVVYGHQELSRTVKVGENGQIDFPFMQSLPVNGLTVERLREIIVAQLSRYLDSYPVVTINFTESTTMLVSVLGMVQSPGQKQLPLKSTLQAAISAGGGFLPGARTQQISVLRERNNRMTTETYNLERFVLEGDMKYNPTLQPRDIVLVTGNPLLSSVKVIGEVNNPGTYDAFMGATLLDMILQAGGPTEKAKLSKVRYISPARKKSYEFKIDLEKIFTTNDYYQLPVVKAGDIIVIPKKSDINIYKTIIGVVRDISSVLILAWYLERLQN